MSAPIVRLVLALCAGVVASLGWTEAWLVLAAAASLAALASRATRFGDRVCDGAAARAWPLLAICACGALLGADAVERARDDCRHAPADHAVVRARGTLGRPLDADATARLQLTHLRVGERWSRCAGAVRVRLPDTDTTRSGARVEVRGVWWATAHATPLEPDRAGLLRADRVRALRERPARLERMRGAAAERIRRQFGADAPLVASLLVADRSGMDPDVRERYAAAGLAHLLSISGLHVALIASVVLLIARVLRLPVRRAAMAAAAATVLYVAFLGAPYPAVRAVLQVQLALASVLLQRPARPGALIAAAALPIVALDPLALRDVGFQLSFAGVIGIVALRRRLLDVLSLPLKPLRESVAVSLAATIATAPVTALHFGQVAPVGVLANIVAVPLSGLLVPALALALAAGAAWQPLGDFLAGGARVLIRALDACAQLAAQIPGGHFAAGREDLLAAALACGGALVTWRFLRAGSGPTIRAPSPKAAERAAARRRALHTLVAASAAACVFVVSGAGARGRGVVEIHAIDVGQGDAFAIRSPAGRWLLVDAGPRSADFDAGRARVVPYLQKRGVRALELFVISHPDADHVGGAAAVLRTLRVGAVLDPGVALARPLHAEALALASRRGVRWLRAAPDAAISLDDMVLEVLHPAAAQLDAATEANDLSVAIRLVFGEFEAIFLGDASSAVERLLVQRHGARLMADLLKVGHHGSATSTSEVLLEAVRPRAALISLGRRNRYGHPAPEVLERLAGAGAEVWRTDVHGNIRVRADAQGRLEIRGVR